MDIPRFNARDDRMAITAALQEAGVVIIESLFDQELIQGFLQDLQPYHGEIDSKIAHINELIAAFFGEKTKHLAGLATKSKHFVDGMMCNPLLLGLCDDILLPSCAKYQLNLGHLMNRGPGSVPQMFHRDEDIWIHMPRPHPELELATMIALDDFTADNGATLIVPGSHQWPRERQPQDHEIEQAVMPKGSAVIYLGSVLHAGGANTTSSDWRPGVHLSYCLGWLRTEENNYLTTPPEVAKTLSLQAQDLLAYSIHDAIEDFGGYLGVVDLKDPVTWLNGDQVKTPD